MSNAIQQIYFSYFGRAADPAGLADWLAQINAGTDISAVRSAFGSPAQPEFVALYGNATNEQFFDIAYANILNRSADAEGKAYWLDTLAQRTAANIEAGFSAQDAAVSARAELLSSIIFAALEFGPASPDYWTITNQTQLAVAITAAVSVDGLTGEQITAILIATKALFNRTDLNQQGGAAAAIAEIAGIVEEIVGGGVEAETFTLAQALAGEVEAGVPYNIDTDAVVEAGAVNVAAAVSTYTQVAQILENAENAAELVLTTLFTWDISDTAEAILAAVGNTAQAVAITGAGVVSLTEQLITEQQAAELEKLPNFDGEFQVQGVTIELTAANNIVSPTVEDPAFRTTKNDDTIVGVVAVLGDDNTLRVGDQIDGGAGVDTLKVELRTNFNGFSGDGKLQNVEIVDLTNNESIARAFNATGITGVEKYVLNPTGAAINLTDLAAAGIEVAVNGQASGGFTVGFTTAAVAGTADALTLGVNAVGTARTEDAAPKYVTPTATGIENLTVNATGNNLLNLKDAATKSIVVQGTGTLTVNEVNTNISVFDASALQGGLAADLTKIGSSKLTTLKGSEGNSEFNITVGSLTATANLQGGGGQNTLVLSGSGIVEPTMSQFQTLGLADIGNLTFSGAKATDVNAVLIAGKGITGGNTATLTGLSASELTVDVRGNQSAAGTLKLDGFAGALTYNTTAAAATVTSKGQDTAADKLSAEAATSAIINIGQYTKQTGQIDLAKATSVQLNVASGKDGETEKTVFDANLTANAAGSVVIRADGVLGVGGNDTLNAKNATLLDAQVAGGGAMNFQMEKAQQVIITAGKGFDIQGSNFAAAEQVTLTANAEKIDGSTINLAKIVSLTLAGAGEVKDKESAIVLGNLGNPTLSNNVGVTISGLKGGATLGTINTNGTNVTINATQATGDVTVSTIGNAKAVGNVTINAATAGSTEIGNISTVATATVTINANQGELEVGTVAVAANDSGKNTGAINVDLSGVSKAFDLGDLTAKDVTVNMSGYTGGPVTATQLGIINGQNVTVTGTNLAANTITIDPNSTDNETAATISVTGGLANDTLIIGGSTNDVGTSAGDAFKITFNGGGGSDTIKFVDRDVDLTNTGSSLTLNSVETLWLAADDKAATFKAADITGKSLQLKITNAAGTGEDTDSTITLKGTSSADTINLASITTAKQVDAALPAAQVIVQGGGGNDTITLPNSIDHNFTVKMSTTFALNGTDQVINFNGGTGNDIIDFNFAGGTGELAQTALFGTGTGYLEIGSGGTITANTGLIVYTASIADFNIATVVTAANSVANQNILNTDDLMFFVFDNGTDSALFSLKSNGTDFVATDAARLITLTGIANASATLTDANFADFSLPV